MDFSRYLPQQRNSENENEVCIYGTTPKSIKIDKKKQNCPEIRKYASNRKMKKKLLID